MDHFNKRIQIKSSKKRSTRQRPGKVWARLPGVPSQENYTRMHLLLPAMMCDNTREGLLTSKAPLHHSVHGFYWGPVTYAYSTPAPNLSYSQSSTTTPLPEPKQRFPTNPIARADLPGHSGAAWAQAYAYRNSLSRQPPPWA